MSSKVVKTITIEGLNPKNGGVLDSEGTWRSLSKFGRTLDGKPLTTDLFVKGQSYTVEVAAGKTGGEFIAGVVGSKLAAVKPASPSTAERIPAKQWDRSEGPFVKPYAEINDHKLEAPKDDYEAKKKAKDTDIGRRGLLQAAAISLGATFVGEDDNQFAEAAYRRALALEAKLNNWGE
jgi:hypothetical protein